MEDENQTLSHRKPLNESELELGRSLSRSPDDPMTRYPMIRSPDRPMVRSTDHMLPPSAASAWGQWLTAWRSP